MVKCCAPLCSNASYKKHPDITFHRFPKDINLKNAWLAKLGRKNFKPKPSTVLCSDHFEAHLVDDSGFRSVLVHGAVPTIFDLSFQKKHELPRPARGETIKQESQNLQQSTSDATPYCHELPRPATGVTIKQESQNLQWSTSDATPYCQELPRPAREVTIKQESQNLQRSTSDATPYCNILTPSTKGLVKNSASGDHMLHELQNLQPNISDVTQTCIVERTDPQNRTQYCCSSARDLSRLKAKLILKDKTLKALREKIRRFKKKVAKFSDIITELKRKLQDRDLSLEKHNCK